MSSKQSDPNATTDVAKTLKGVCIDRHDTNGNLDSEAEGAMREVITLDAPLLHPMQCRCLGGSNDDGCPYRWSGRVDLAHKAAGK